MHAALNCTGNPSSPALNVANAVWSSTAPCMNTGQTSVPDTPCRPACPDGSAHYPSISAATSVCLPTGTWSNISSASCRQLSAGARKMALAQLFALLQGLTHRVLSSPGAVCTGPPPASLGSNHHGSWEANCNATVNSTCNLLCWLPKRVTCRAPRPAGWCPRQCATFGASGSSWATAARPAHVSGSRTACVRLPDCMHQACAAISGCSESRYLPCHCTWPQPPAPGARCRQWGMVRGSSRFHLWSTAPSVLERLTWPLRRCTSTGEHTRARVVPPPCLLLRSQGRSGQGSSLCCCSCMLYARPP